jgi:pimeloyl-ACP methyl ester carboxylesterase
MSLILNELKFPKPTLISVNGIELEVFEAGQENAGSPIILCHGWPGHAFSWRYQISALVETGYHVIIPNQRGFGKSSCPKAVTAYDIEHLTGDLVALLDYYGYKDATFIGHDWGANIVWSMALLHPCCVNGIIALALPYQIRGDRPWIELLEDFFGSDYYFVHFNRQPCIADAILDESTFQFLRNIFRKDVLPKAPEQGNAMISLAKANKPLGNPIMSDQELAVFVSAFESTGFTASINWYRNLDRNWHLLAGVNPIIQKPALMIYGKRDVIPRFEKLSEFVPKVEEVHLDCGHWIQQELPNETNQAIGHG